MMRVLKSCVVALCAAACSSTGNGDGGGGGGGGGSGGGTGQDPFTIYTLDADGGIPTYLAMAYHPTQRRVGAVYYAPRGTQTQAGHDDFDIKYVEWRDGATQPIETLRYVQRTVGLALAFHPASGEPVVAYVGGAPGFDAGSSIYWFQSDAVINRRSGTTWGPEVVVAATGADTTCGNTVSDRGFLVGLWPALVYDSTGKLYFAWRDGHDAQFPQQDWNGSDVELAEGTPGPGMTRTCIKAGGNDKQAWGGRIQLVLGPGDQPAMVYDQVFGTVDGTGNNVILQRRTGTSWTGPAAVMNVANTQTGASLAYDATEGWGIAVLEGTTSQLQYLRSTDGANWTSPDPVFGLGSGGWYPSLAMDPKNHEPAIAFYVCSPRPGVTPSGCLASEDELRITQRISRAWREVLVDREGGYAPKLGFFAPVGGAEAKRFVVYRHPRTGAVKLAVEK